MWTVTVFNPIIRLFYYLATKPHNNPNPIGTLVVRLASIGEASPHSAARSIVASLRVGKCAAIGELGY